MVGYKQKIILEKIKDRKQVLSSEFERFFLSKRHLSTCFATLELFGFLKLTGNPGVFEVNEDKIKGYLENIKNEN